MKATKIRFGIVGFGHIGQRHATCIINNQQADLVAVYDILSIDELNTIELDNDIFLSSFDDLLKLNLDVINVCTPNYLHTKMVLDILNTGHHVVVEKPMTLSVQDAQRIIDTEKSTQKKVFCVMQNRFSPTIMWLKKIISQNILGRVYMTSIHCFWNRNENYYLKSGWHGSKEKDGGPLFTQFSHFIDVLYWLFGTPVNITPEFLKFKNRKYVEYEDSGIVKFDFSHNMKCVLNYSTIIWNKNFESSITIIGEFGSIKIGGQYMDKIIYCDIKNYILPDINNDVKCNDYGDYQGSASNHDKMIDNVINVLLRNQDIHTGTKDGLRVVEIIEKIYSYRS